jgi:hypothetical protein
MKNNIGYKGNNGEQVIIDHLGKSLTFIPDPKKHLIVSLVKSVIRIGGYALLLFSGNHWITASGIVLIISELIGIIEELV